MPFLPQSNAFEIRQHIATEQEEPERAAQWLRRIFDKIDGLAKMPRRYQKATEDAWRDYEIRRVSIGQFILFFTIVEEAKTVWVIHAKHVRQKTRGQDLPGDLESLDDD